MVSGKASVYHSQKFGRNHAIVVGKEVESGWEKILRVIIEASTKTTSH
jgi:hypothetical protein